MKCTLERKSTTYSFRATDYSEIQLLHNQCEQERTQILTNFLLALQNPRLAGYMLTGNRSNISGNRWKRSMALPLPESSLASPHNEPVL